jgi:hypothetical protein
MSMLCEFKQISPEQLEAFIKDPSQVYDLFQGHSQQEYLAAVEAFERSRSLFSKIVSKILGQKKDGGYINFLPPAKEGTEPTLDIDKSWHAIDFMLNGREWEEEPPLFKVILGGTAIGDDDLGYGPARYLTPEQVQEVTAALEKISEADFIKKYDPKQMGDIYPHVWGKNDKETLDYLVGHYRKMVAFYKDAAQKGNAIISLLY